MGLWDLRANGEGRLARVPTVLVDRYRELVAGGTEAVGRLGEAVADWDGGARVP
jgi:hypothetical protein